MKFTSTATKSKATIDAIQMTNDTLTGRGGLALFAHYPHNIHILQKIDTFFGSVCPRRKGQPITEIFKQLLCIFVDGTSRPLVDFDALAKDAAYAATESEPASMLSSHAVKRFFCSFCWPRIYLFRHLGCFCGALTCKHPIWWFWASTP